METPATHHSAVPLFIEFTCTFFLFESISIKTILLGIVGYFIFDSPKLCNKCSVNAASKILYSIRTIVINESNVFI